MSKEIEELLGSSFFVKGIGFTIDEAGFVICSDGMDLGHIEECLEEGLALIDLTELISHIDLGLNI